MGPIWGQSGTGTFSWLQPIWDRHISLAPTDLGQALSVAASDLGQALEPIWDRHISLAPTDLGQALSVAVE